MVFVMNLSLHFKGTVILLSINTVVKPKLDNFNSHDRASPNVGSGDKFFVIY